MSAPFVRRIERMNKKGTQSQFLLIVHTMPGWRLLSHHRWIFSCYVTAVGGFVCVLYIVSGLHFFFSVSLLPFISHYWFICSCLLPYSMLCIVQDHWHIFSIVLLSTLIAIEFCQVLRLFTVTIQFTRCLFTQLISNFEYDSTSTTKKRWRVRVRWKSKDNVSNELYIWSFKQSYTHTHRHVPNRNRWVNSSLMS